MFLTQDDLKQIALSDMIRHLNEARKAAKSAGFDWEMDDDIATLIEYAEFEYNQ